jgi:hypothetical protein
MKRNLIIKKYYYGLFIQKKLINHPHPTPYIALWDGINNSINIERFVMDHIHLQILSSLQNI